jgi:hypothetical protein
MAFYQKGTKYRPRKRLSYEKWKKKKDEQLKKLMKYYGITWSDTARLNLLKEKVYGKKQYS